LNCRSKTGNTYLSLWLGQQMRNEIEAGMRWSRTSTTTSN
jgi:hypothetical protein